MSMTPINLNLYEEALSDNSNNISQLSDISQESFQMNDFLLNMEKQFISLDKTFFYQLKEIEILEETRKRSENDNEQLLQQNRTLQSLILDLNAQNKMLQEENAEMKLNFSKIEFENKSLNKIKTQLEEDVSDLKFQLINFNQSDFSDSMCKSCDEFRFRTSRVVEELLMKKPSSEELKNIRDHMSSQAAMSLLSSSDSTLLTELEYGIIDLVKVNKIFEDFKINKHFNKINAQNTSEKVSRQSSPRDESLASARDRLNTSESRKSQGIMDVLFAAGSHKLSNIEPTYTTSNRENEAHVNIGKQGLFAAKEDPIKSARSKILLHRSFQYNGEKNIDEFTASNKNEKEQKRDTFHNIYFQKLEQNSNFCHNEGASATSEDLSQSSAVISIHSDLTQESSSTIESKDSLHDLALRLNCYNRNSHTKSDDPISSRGCKDSSRSDIEALSRRLRSISPRHPISPRRSNIYYNF